MSRVTPLNVAEHHDLKVQLGHGARWGDAVNQELVFPTEYEELQRDYPIVLRREDDGAFRSMVLLGLDRDENLYLGEDGTWRASYVPAARLIGPFRLGTDPHAPEEGPKILVDLDHPRVGRTEGAPLFLPQGGRAPYLEQMARVLRGVHVGLGIEKPMVDAFVAHDLIEPKKLEITVDEELRYDVPDVFVIGAERLARLDGAALEALHRQGFLRLAFMLSASLANVGRLIALKGEKRRAAGLRDVA